MWRSTAMIGRAGVMSVDAACNEVVSGNDEGVPVVEIYTSVAKEKRDTMIVNLHLIDFDQLRGFSGSPEAKAIC
jgi:hypothetical protein